MFEDHPGLAALGVYGFCGMMSVLIAQSADFQHPSHQAEVAAVGFAIAAFVLCIVTYFAAAKGYFDVLTDSLIGNSILGIGVGVVFIVGAAMLVVVAMMAFMLYVMCWVFLAAIAGAFLSSK